ncbi:MAG TPA: DUF3040 domain-containing protein [Galbitalea sp.]|jgi:hypothetical protein
MPLSEQEQRLLEEMERSLYHNDADFVAAVSARHGKPTYSVVVAGILVGVVGLAVLVTGVAIRLPIIGVLGFVIMFAGVLIAVTPPRGGRVSANAPDAQTGGTGAHDSSGKAPGAKETHRGTFMQNLSDRWDNRQDDREE